MPTSPIRLARRPHLPLTLTIVSLDPAKLTRLSTHNTGEPYFGRTRSNRFDDPNPVESDRYGTSYFGQSLAVAIAELVERVPRHYSAGFGCLFIPAPSHKRGTRHAARMSEKIIIYQLSDIRCQLY